MKGSPKTSPNNIFALRQVRGPPYLVCIGLIVAASLAILLLVSSVSAEPFLVPSAVLTLFLLLSGRAAAAHGRGLTSR